MTKLCGQNCSQTYSPLVYQCIEREHKENIRSQTCNTTKFNLISSEEDFVTKQTCHCEGNQCHLKCTKIQCTQNCRERKTGEYLINLNSHQGSLYKKVSGNGVMAFTANFFLRLTVKMCQFLLLTTKFLAVLQLTVNPFEILI